MNSVWRVLNERALFVSFAGDSFHFEITWLGIILVVAALILWRRLKR